MNVIEAIPEVCAAVPFPSERHRALARETAVALARDARVAAICLTGSIARGVADEQADMDMVVFTAPEHVQALAEAVEARARASAEIWFDLEVTDGEFQPGQHGWMYIDPFELVVGNWVAYARPLFERDDTLQRLRARYLPYYEEALAAERAARLAELTVNHADRVRRGLSRGSLFDAAERLRMGVQSFLAGLFVHRRVYPVDYAKWVEQQVIGLVGLPELLPPLRKLFDIGPLDPERLHARAAALEELVEQWLSR
jgi:predicted nucleotidyltransferase